MALPIGVNLSRSSAIPRVRQGLKPLANSQSPLKRTKELKCVFLSPLKRTLALRQGIHSLSDCRTIGFTCWLTPFRQGCVPTDLTDSRNDRKTQNCDKHNQGIKLSATALKVFQTFARNQGDKPC